MWVSTLRLLSVVGTKRPKKESAATKFSSWLFCFNGSNFSEVASGIRHMRFFWLMIFPMPRARVESNAGERASGLGVQSLLTGIKDEQVNGTAHAARQSGRAKTL